MLSSSSCVAAVKSGPAAVPTPTAPAPSQLVFIVALRRLCSTAVVCSNSIACAPLLPLPQLGLSSGPHLKAISIVNNACWAIGELAVKGLNKSLIEGIKREERNCLVNKISRSEIRGGMEGHSLSVSVCLPHEFTDSRERARNRGIAKAPGSKNRSVLQVFGSSSTIAPRERE
ncbi:hypothetical protein Ahy_A03g014860 isoform A [Arachis hypogaea]|uniref:Uncharacterized protein n=1 Tax=Arachis hypogaea TaxID=3818 RepID=A0A445DYZ6_ARAHY|nr:hypothetical protein Ahy_A03g014860 isoform A [Arachis hypogaea]